MIGMMGSGKSVTGKKLAALLGAGFVDLDEWIEDRTRRTIVDLFEKEGEDFFRAQETAVLKEAAASGPRVVATGGGSVLRAENVERMKKTGRVIYLETSPDVLWQRVKEKKDRPLLKHPNPREKLAQILAERGCLYERACDFRVGTDGRTAEAVAAEIFELLKERK